MGKEYSTPVVEFEAYNLTNQIAGACANAGKTPVGDVKPITIANTTVHCVDEDGKPKNCSKGAHTWVVNLEGTIFADGNLEGGCTNDVYTEEQYLTLLMSSTSDGSKISGGEICEHGTHFIFKGHSHQHVASFTAADYSNYFQS